LGFSFFCRPVLADEPHIALSEYFIETWSTKDGLPHNSINDIAQTREGYLWFGTWEGFARTTAKPSRSLNAAAKAACPIQGRWRLSPGQTAACWLQAHAVASHPGKRGLDALCAGAYDDWFRHARQ
jgi:ligand-binding sensor domain-containing protein